MTEQTFEERTEGDELVLPPASEDPQVRRNRHGKAACLAELDQALAGETFADLIEQAIENADPDNQPPVVEPW